MRKTTVHIGSDFYRAQPPNRPSRPRLTKAGTSLPTARLAAFILGGLLCIVCLLGCSPSPSPATTPPSALPTTIPATPAPTPIPWAEFNELSLLPGEDANSWHAIGLVRNFSDRGVSAIRLLVSLKDTEGTVIAQQEIAPALTHLSAGEVSPFSAEFHGIEGAASAQAAVKAQQDAAIPRANVEVEGIDIATMEGGELVILGRLVNREEVSVVIENLAFLARDSEGQPYDLAEWEAGLSLLPPAGSTPFSARSSLAPDSVVYTPYVDALVAAPEPSPSPITLPLSPWLRIDDRQNPFILGMIHNASPWPRWASLVIAVSYRGKLASVVELRTPIPIAAGDSTAYSLDDIPGLSAQLSDQDWELRDLSVEAWIDPAKSSSSELPIQFLDSDIIGHELLGTSLFFRGTVTNQIQQEVLSPTVLATLRDQSGSIISAGWVVAGESLKPGKSIEFILFLRLPSGTSPAASEYDLRAMGLIP